MSPILYSMDLSPPCRAVLLTAGAIGLKLDVREMNLLKKEHLSSEFVKINPQHTLPTLDDIGFVVWDSHAIIRYLVAKYAKNDNLYPQDYQKRALIDQKLHFEGEMLFTRMRNTLRPIFFFNAKELLPESLELLHEACDIFNKFLEGKKWLVGDSYTLADISCVSSISSMEAFFPFDKYPNIVRWLRMCEKEIPGYAEANGVGVKKIHESIKAAIQK